MFEDLYVQHSRSIYKLLLEGIVGNICVKLFKFGTAILEMSFKEIFYGRCMSEMHSGELKIEKYMYSTINTPLLSTGYVAVLEKQVFKCPSTKK